MLSKHKYCLRSDTTQKTLLDQKEVKMAATKQDVEELLKSHSKSKRCFEPNDFSGKSSENARDFLSSFVNYCTLNNIEGKERILTFEMCLQGAAKCWYLTLKEAVKTDFDKISEEFTKNFLQNNKWLNTTRLENRRLLSTESAETYIADMSNLALLLGIEDQELAKCLIRGLPTRLRSHVISHNPANLSETTQRILLGQFTLSFGDKEGICAISDNNITEGQSISDVLNRLSDRMDRLEELLTPDNDWM